jgi:hypothetical protein
MRPFISRINDLESALRHERQRSNALERRCQMLEASREITARLLTRWFASGGRRVTRAVGACLGTSPVDGVGVWFAIGPR